MFLIAGVIASVADLLKCYTVNGDLHLAFSIVRIFP